MPTSLNLSTCALAVLERALAGKRVKVTDEPRPFYRELVEAGMMMPLHTFARGNEGAYRLTEAACELREGLGRRATDFTQMGLADPPTGV